MANPSKAASLLADKSDNPMIAGQQDLVADAGAITAYTAVENMTDPVTKAEGEAVSAALAGLVLEVVALRTQVLALADILEAHGLMADA